MRPSTHLFARPRSLLPLLMGVLVAAGLAACSGPSAGGLSGKSASQILALAKSAAQKEGSFHFIDETGSGTKKQELIGNTSSKGDSEEELSSPNGNIEVRLDGSMLYVYASEGVLENALKLSTSSAQRYADKWISLESSSTPYQTVLTTIRPSAELAPYFPASGLKVGSPQTLDGHSVVPVSGVASSAAQTSATATVYVSSSAPYVPIGGSLIGTGSEKNDTEIVTFTEWGARFAPQVPSGAVAYSTVASS